MMVARATSVARQSGRGRGRHLRDLATLMAGALASAAALALYATMQWPWIALGFVALVPWLVALDRARTFGARLAGGWLMSVAYALCLFPWLPDALHEYTGASRSSALVFMLALAPALAPQFLALALARHLGALAFATSAARTRLAVTAGVLAYVAVDGLVAKPMADPLALPLYGSALLRQGADLAGVAGLTLALLVANECALAALGAIVCERNARAALRAPLAAVFALLAVMLLYGVVRTHEYARPGEAPTLSVGLIQAGLSHYDRMTAEFGRHQTVQRVLDRHVALSREALAVQPLDLLVWPETVYPLNYGTPDSEIAARLDARIDELVQRTGVPLLFGTYSRQRGADHNAAVVLEPADGGVRLAARYHKVRLFPLSERTPRVLDDPRVRARWPWLGTWRPGDGPAALEVQLSDGRRVRIAPMICYDTATTAHAVASVRQGAELIVTLSNDSWFAYGHAQELLLATAGFRSIETRRPQLRVANTGISAVIEPDGRVTGHLSAGAAGPLVAAVSPRSAGTLVLRYGDWLPRACGVALVLLLGAGLARRWRGYARKKRQAIQSGTPA